MLHGKLLNFTSQFHSQIGIHDVHCAPLIFINAVVCHKSAARIIYAIVVAAAGVVVVAPMVWWY